MSQSVDRASMFWDWFAGHVDDIAAGAHRSSEIRDLPPVLVELSSRVVALGFGGAWEIGPDDRGWFFCVSPGASADRLAETKEFVALAPSIAGWVFHAAKPAKIWDRRAMTFDGGEVDVDSWQYQLRRWDDGAMGIIWGLPERPPGDDGDWDELGWMLLESELGEAVVIQHFVDVEMVVNPPWLLDDSGNKISILRDHVQQLTDDVGDA